MPQKHAAFKSALHHFVVSGGGALAQLQDRRDAGKAWVCVHAMPCLAGPRTMHNVIHASVQIVSLARVKISKPVQHQVM